MPSLADHISGTVGRYTQHIGKRNVWTVCTKCWPQKVRWRKLALQLALSKSRTDPKCVSATRIQLNLGQHMNGIQNSANTSRDDQRMSKKGHLNRKL